MKGLKCSANKLLIILLISTVLSACGGAEERKAKYLAKGKAYLEQKNYKKAKIELKNVLQIDPKYAEAHYLLGTVEEADRNWPKAWGRYNKALELDPKYGAAQVKIGYFNLLQNKVDEASELADAVLQADPEHIEGRMLKVSILVRKKESQKGLIIAKKIVEDEPENAMARILLATVYESDKQLEKSLSVLREGAEKLDKNIEIRSLLVGRLLKDKQYDEAEKILRESITIEPDNFVHRTKLAVLYTALNRLDDAEKVLRDAITAQPDDDLRILQLVSFLGKRRGVKEAVEELEEYIQKQPESMVLRFSLAGIYSNYGQIEKSKDIYRVIIDSQGTDIDGLKARNKLARILMKERNYKDTIRYVEEILAENPQDNEALLLKGMYGVNTGNAGMAINALRVVVRDQPDLIDASSILSRAHMQNGEPQLAKEVLQRTIEASKNSPKAFINYAIFLAQQGFLDESLGEIDKALALAPKNIEVLTAKAQILTGKKNYKGAEAIYKKIIALQPDKSEHYDKLGQYYLNQKNYIKAINNFEKSFKMSGKLLPSMAGIVRTYLASGAIDKAEKRISKLVQKYPDNAIAHELMSEVFIFQKKFSRAEQEARSAIKINPKWELPYTTLATAYFSQGNQKGGMGALEEGLKNASTGPKLKALLANEYLRSKEYDKARDIYEQMLKEDQGNKLAANNLASLLVDNYNDDKARDRAKELVQYLKDEKQVSFQDTVGWIYYRTGQVKEAIPVLEAVVKRAPKVAIFNYHLGMVYYTDGNKGEARKYLSAALKTKGNFPGRESAEKALQALKE